MLAGPGRQNALRFRLQVVDGHNHLHLRRLWCKFDEFCNVIHRCEDDSEAGVVYTMELPVVSFCTVTIESHALHVFCKRWDKLGTRRTKARESNWTRTDRVLP